MSNEEQIWLCREGKTEGPFNPVQIEEMKTSGEYKKYSWIWTASSKNWAPIYPPPPPPTPVTQQPKAESAQKTAPIAAICYDNRSVVSGQIEYSMVSDPSAASDSILKSADHADTLPPFKKGSTLSIHLLDEASGQTEVLKAKLVDFKKTDSVWEYRLQWVDTPQLIRPQDLPLDH